VSSHTTAAFRRPSRPYLPNIRDRARVAFELFSENPRHPSLQLKQVHDSKPIYSARITLQYRALATRTDEDWIWFWIGSHADYDNLLKRL
jgi:hypothetical protein